MIDPRTALAIKATHLSWLLPKVDADDLPDVRREFARFLHTPQGQAHATWQSAWNSWTGARADVQGHFAYVTARCSRCLGKGSMTRSRGAETFSPVCGNCRGSGTGQRVERVARYAAV